MPRINITAVSGERGLGNQISSFAVAGLASRDCTSLRVTVRNIPNGIILFPVTTVQPANNPFNPAFNNTDPENDDTWVAYFDMTQVALPGLSISCGSTIFIEVAGLGTATGFQIAEMRQILCKTLDPDSNNDDDNNGNNGGNNNNGNNPPGGGINWPSWVCPSLARIYGLILWAALIAVAVVVAGTNLVPFPVITAALIAAAAVLALWLLICRPSLCTILRITTTVLMTAVIVTAIMAIVVLNYRVAVLAAIYGAITGCLVKIMQSAGCRVPRIF